MTPSRRSPTIVSAIAAIERELRKISQATEEELVEAIGAIAQAAGACVEQAHDAESHNRLMEVEAAVYRELRSRGPEAARKILGLLDYDDVFARLCGATLGLEFAPKEAVRVLGRIVDRREAANATMYALITPQQWRNGELKFPLPQHAV